MQKIFDEVNSLDKRCYEEFFKQNILMEHAASSMCSYIEDIFEENKSVLIVSEVEIMVLMDQFLLDFYIKKFDVNLYLASEPKSSMAKLQYKRVKTLNIKSK